MKSLIEAFTALSQNEGIEQIMSDLVQKRQILVILAQILDRSPLDIKTATLKILNNIAVDSKENVLAMVSNEQLMSQIRQATESRNNDVSQEAWIVITMLLTKVSDDKAETEQITNQFVQPLVQ